MRVLSTTVVTLSILWLAPMLSPVPAEEEPVQGARVLDEVWSIARDNFLDPDFNGIDWSAARERYREEAAVAATSAELSDVINRMLDELGTSHTAYYTPEQVEYHHLRDIFRRAFRKPGPMRAPDDRPAYTGIGVFTRVIDGKRFVTGVIEGTPAERAGLHAGDEIVSADGGPFGPIASFAGKDGRTVKLQVRRTTGPTGRLEIDVVPELIVPSRMFLGAIESSARIVEHEGVKVGYVHLWSYTGPENHRRFMEVLQNEPLHGADALVMDIRGGWGGARPDYLNVFQRDVPVMTMVGRDGTRRTVDLQWRKPVVLLVNEETRSGKEIIAFGFEKYGFGPVVGARTAGAVLFGKPFLLSNDALLYLANADVLVDGIRLEGTGVEPDVVVPFDVRYSAGDDPQLERAIEVAASLLVKPEP